MFLKFTPDNDSKVTLDEVKYLSKIKPRLEFIKEKDDVVDTFMELVEETGVKIRKR